VAEIEENLDVLDFLNLLPVEGVHRAFKIQHQGPGTDLPQGGEFVPFAVSRRANSYSIMMEEDMENGVSYQERPRTFSTVRSRSSVPLV
jgi:hypothetical protein